MITVSSGITRFKKDQIISAMIHNHRLENSHRNIINDNANFFYDMNTQQQGQIFIYEDKKEQRAKVRTKAKDTYKKHFDRQMELMTERNKEKGYKRPKAKDLNPIAEGVVNFGGVYDINNDTNEERIRKTEEFHNSFTEKEWGEIFHQIKTNLEEFCHQTKTELLDITFHRDEEGLYHIHYLVTNYNNQTGEHLNIRQNKNGRGDLLQDVICQNMGKYGMGRAKGRESKKRMSKEELIRFREVNNELEETKKELEEKKEELRILKNNIEDCKIEASKIIFTLNYFIEELSKIDPNDKYGAKDKLEQLLKSAQWAIGKGKMEVAQSKLDNLEKILKAMEKKGLEGNLSKDLSSMRSPNMD